MDLAFPGENWEMDKQQVYDSIIYSLNRDVTSASVQFLNCISIIIKNLAKIVINFFYNRVCLVGHLSNRTILQKIYLTGKFIFWESVKQDN